MLRKTYMSFLCGLILIFGGTAMVSPLWAQEKSQKIRADDEIWKAIQGYLQERTKLSGTLDLYDQNKQIVRNLKTFKRYDTITKSNGIYAARMDFRDINIGDVVNVVFVLEDKDDQLVFKYVNVQNVIEMKNSRKADKVYSDQEAQDVMQKYLDSQAKFTGAISVFDKDAEKLRQLKLMSLDNEVRRLGNYYISSAALQDIDTQETVNVDVTVEKIEKGDLAIQGLRIRDVSGAKK